MTRNKTSRSALNDEGRSSWSLAGLCRRVDEVRQRTTAIRSQWSERERQRRAWMGWMKQQQFLQMYGGGKVPQFALEPSRLLRREPARRK